jgi:GT2 family glycosyltransferase
VAYIGPPPLEGEGAKSSGVASRADTARSVSMSLGSVDSANCGLPQWVSSADSALLICVKYGSDEETDHYLESVRSLQSQSSMHVLVVDNTLDGSWGQRSSQFNCIAVQASQNLGYFGGARYGLSHYLSENPLPDWVIVSNVDLTIADPKFLDHLFPLKDDPDLGVVAPSIRSNLTGRDQNPYLATRPSSLRMHFYKWLYRSWLLLNAHELASAAVHKLLGVLRSGRSSDSEGSRREIYAPHGSFLIFSKTYFERDGDLQFPEFLFGEEIYVAEKLRTLKLKAIYEPSLVVIHEEHQSTKLFKSRPIAAYVAASAAYCANTFFPLHSKS